MDEVNEAAPANPGYAFDQLSKAYRTASSHPDPQARARAENRVRRWGQVLSGMLSGRLKVGSRTPVKGMPAWVTPEVVRGGFATGTAAAGGPPLAEEIATAREVGVPADRAALFEHFLSPAGMSQLASLLESGRYRVGLPEESVLLTLAWLVTHGGPDREAGHDVTPEEQDAEAAARLVEQVAPWAGELRFLPRAAATPSGPASVLFRATAGETVSVLRARKPNRQVMTQREAVTVWAPFADDLLALWLQTVEDGRVAEVVTPAWLEQAAAVLARYRVLAAEHTLCGKHRNPKENLAILRAALEETVAGRPLHPRTRGLLQVAVDSMLARRGAPGTAPLERLRQTQRDSVAAPPFHRVAAVVADRLTVLPHDQGISDVPAQLVTVRETEAVADVPAGAGIPAPVARVVRRATAASVEDLLAQQVVPSAEVLAELIPQISAGVMATSYPDARLGQLMGATYQAFRNRRSLLLLDLANQVQFDELPHVAAVAAHRDSTRSTDHARVTAARVGRLTLDAFPGTLIPNPLVQELAALTRSAGLTLPWVEELAADIFMGAFSAKYLRAAHLAARTLQGSLYARYFGIDYGQVLEISDTGQPSRIDRGTGFAALCAARAGQNLTRASGPAAAGTVIEQGQILTTHNLAILTDALGVVPERGWEAAVTRSFDHVRGLITRVARHPRPLATIKDAAYAWRHTVFYLSQLTTAEQRAWAVTTGEQLQSLPEVDRGRLSPVIGGLARVLAGQSLDDQDPDARRFLGWTTGRHWMTS